MDIEPEYRPTEIFQRTDRLKMLCEVSCKMRAVAMDTADRLYGSQPQSEENGSEKDTAREGSLREMDLWLDRLERIMRETEEEITRLSHT